jgi:hypothetical protein
MDKPHVNLIIATPGHSLMSDYVKSLLVTTQELNRRNISWVFTNLYSSHVADAREVTLSGTFQNEVDNSSPLSGNITYDKIMWIDSDIAWTPDDIIKLYESDKDIISGAYLLASGEVVAYKKMFGPGYNYQEVMDMTEPVQIDATGFGFICVKQGVFEKLTRPWFQSVDGTLTIEGQERIMPIMGEDMSWCKRVKDEGYEIWFDPTVKVTHHKTIKLTWNGMQA